MGRPIGIVLRQFFLRQHNMFTVLCSCSLSHSDNGNPVIYNIKYSDRNIHQKIEKNFE